ncbi:MAG: histone deacetylase [Opitutae bacterium]|nr:histone deacetylase [Opitutae bacterium]
MLLFHDPQCADYGSARQPEQPARVVQAVAHLRAAHPEWSWQLPPLADEAMLLLAHTPELLARLQTPPDFDEDTPFFPGIYDHARRSVGAALAAMECALTSRQKAFALMRPPGHHATAGQAMGFCYLNQIAVAALAAQQRGAARVAVWDFDAHHGNGTEAILDGRPGFRFCSVHQFPGYPGTGTRNSSTCRNWALPPHAPRATHLEALRASWDHLLAFQPDLVLVSAGFDAFAGDPVATLSLTREDFATLGRWLAASPAPVAAVLEGGYSTELPHLLDAFLCAWEAPPSG